MSAGPRVEVVNFGCRLNIAEGEAIRAATRAAGARDTIVFNSCAVTDEAVRQALMLTLVMSIAASVVGFLF